MSTDPHGILYYGIALEETEQEKFRGSDFDYHDVNDQWKQSHGPTQPDDRINYKTPEWDAWREANKAWEAGPQNVTINWYGGENCQRYVVHCAGLEKRVEWDEQIDLGNFILGQVPAADEWIKKFCDQVEIPYRQPTWHLAALYF